MQISLPAFKYTLWMPIQRSVGEGIEGEKIPIFFFLIPLPVKSSLLF